MQETYTDSMEWVEVVKLVEDECRHSEPLRSSKAVWYMLKFMVDVVFPERMAPPDKVEISTQPQIEIVMYRHQGDVTVKVCCSDEGLSCSSSIRHNKEPENEKPI